MGSIRPLLGWNWVGIGQDFDATTRTSFWGRIVTTIIIRVISSRRGRTRGVCPERRVAWDQFFPRMPRTARTSGICKILGNHNIKGLISITPMKILDLDRPKIIELKSVNPFSHFKGTVLYVTTLMDSFAAIHLMQRIHCANNVIMVHKYKCFPS